MDVAENSYLLHSKAWNEHDKTKTHLADAYSLLNAAYEGGDSSNLVVNNLAAVLLDLYRDEEALSLLKRHNPECNEYCLNFAIAVVKQKSSDINEVRKWNKKASSYPKFKNAIVAYMDWQGL